MANCFVAIKVFSILLTQRQITAGAVDAICFTPVSKMMELLIWKVAKKTIRQYKAVFSCICRNGGF